MTPDLFPAIDTLNRHARAVGFGRRAKGSA